jgi:hypothetical protein
MAERVPFELIKCYKNVVLAQIRFCEVRCPSPIGTDFSAGKASLKQRDLIILRFGGLSIEQFPLRQSQKKVGHMLYGTAVEQTAKALLLCLGVFFSTTCASALEAVFHKPTYKRGPARLDVCQHFGESCGQTAADHYCRIQGYEKAIRFETEPATPTRVIFGRECNGPGCVAFKFIVCFTRAQKRGRGLDWPGAFD